MTHPPYKLEYRILMAVGRFPRSIAFTLEIEKHVRSDLLPCYVEAERRLCYLNMLASIATAD